MGRIIRKLRGLRLLSLDHRDHGVPSEHTVENTDSLAAAGMRGGDSSSASIHSGALPNYVKTDEGRRRH